MECAGCKRGENLVDLYDALPCCDALVCCDYCLEIGADGSPFHCPACSKLIRNEVRDDGGVEVFLAEPEPLTMTLATRHGPDKIEVKARAGVWALHQTLDDDLPPTWNVSHIPTGYAATSFHREEAATAIYERLITHHRWWQFEADHAELVECKDDVGKLVLACIRYEGEEQATSVPLTRWRCKNCAVVQRIHAPQFMIVPVCPECPGREMEIVND